MLLGLAGLKCLAVPQDNLSPATRSGTARRCAISGTGICEHVRRTVGRSHRVRASDRRFSRALIPEPGLTTIQQLLSWIQATSISTAIRRADWAVMALEAVHLLGLALLGGAACILALAAVRRSGLRGLSVATLARGLRPLFGIGLLLMIASGTFIVLSMPFKYYLNTAFRVKMLLLVAAVPATAWLLGMAGRPASRLCSARSCTAFGAVVAGRGLQRTTDRFL